MIDDTCSAQWLCDQLCSSTDAAGDVLVLDCRSADEYAAAHVAGSLPVVVPSIMLRRLRNGGASVAAVVSGDASARSHFTDRCQTSHIVLYDAAGDVVGLRDGATDSVVQVLMNRLKKDGCSVNYLLGMYRRRKYMFTTYFRKRIDVIEFEVNIASGIAIESRTPKSYFF